MESNRYAPPEAAVADLHSADAAPALWNPNAAANWSLLFSPVFGAWLHTRNWQALGETERAKTSRKWLVAGIVIVAAQLAAGVLLRNNPGLQWLMNIGAFVWLFTWYFASARGQARHVKERFGDDYPRKGWGRPLLIAVAILFGVSGIFGVLAGMVMAALH
jgi:hypothetical protein